MQNEEKIFWHAFNCIEGFGPQAFKRLLVQFSSLEKAWQAKKENIDGISGRQLKKFFEFREENSPERLFSELAGENIKVVTVKEDSYPPLLREIPSAPPVIYARGNIEAFKNKLLAVVGSRKFTTYGERVAENLCRDLSRAGITIVSGLALGIDGIAHRAALDAEGATIAVLGTGIDDATIYPREHFNLAKRIMESGGILVSEFPPKTPSLKQNFPARNRIMAGLALGTLVIEAAEKSGSLITANWALEFDREVFAVPGDIFSPQAAGTNNLIKSGAKLVKSAMDILEELRISLETPTSKLSIFEPKTEEEKIVWKILSHEPLHVDRISKLTKLNPATLNSVLSVLEVEGAIKNIGGQNYIRI